MTDEYQGTSSGSPNGIDAQEVKARTDLFALVSSRVKLARSGGHEFRGVCPFHGGSGRHFSVNRAKGTYNCHSTSCGAKGDCFTWVMHWDGLTFRDALTNLAHAAGIDTGTGPVRAKRKPVVVTWSKADEDRENQAKAETARRAWRFGVPVSGTLAESYLNARGIFAHQLRDGVWPASLRYDPACAYIRRDADGRPIERLHFPALIAAVQNLAGQVVGLDRIYLNKDGHLNAESAGKLRTVRGIPVDDSKKMLGVIRGNALRFGPAGERLHLAEGLETGLSVCTSVNGEPVWSTLSLGNWIIDLPEIVRSVVLWVDNDEKDRAGARRVIAQACEHYASKRISVRIVTPPDGMDWNDVLRGKAIFPDKCEAVGVGKLPDKRAAA